PLPTLSQLTKHLMFLAALAFSYFSKSFSGVIMKSSITQIERRFDISSSTAGIIDGSFEMGNLLVIAFVSYFGAKLHRPKIIAAGCFIMGIGSILTAMPHFFMGYYKYETASRAEAQVNSSSSISPCSVNQNLMEASEIISNCEKETSSNMWMFVLMGNMLRGIGETPITPLGISYLDDFSKAEDAPFYIGCLHTIAMMGPMAGFLLSSLCARLYVDIGFVDLGSITISLKDSRWVGAWWLGFLIAGVTNLISAIPFCFLPKSLKLEAEENNAKITSDVAKINGDQIQKQNTENHLEKRSASLKDFFKALKRILTHPLYMTFLFCSLLQFNSFIGYITFKPKYMEQQYGQSTSKSNFITGLTALPAVGIGIFLGGVIMKKYKLGLIGATKLAFGMSFVAFLLSLLYFMVGCENHVVAGLTASYDGKPVAHHESSLFSACNADCRCAGSQWDPVCGENGITYVSPCLAGCKASTGYGKGMVSFHNCSCLDVTGSPSGNASVILGECPKSDDCSRKFIYYIVIQGISAFFYALGGTPAFMIMIRCVHPDLKSLAVGLYLLMMRTLAGIPAPVYFGAVIDRNCLKWGIRGCGQQGACRIYDATAYRYTYLGLVAGLRGPSYLVAFVFFMLVKKHFRAKDSKVTQNGEREGVLLNEEANSKSNELLTRSPDADKETCI
uniref:Solute carrier organic anion transporter family member n=1 Tax=Sphenodon punctatus TaxID=8508 RepID=A0A8D0LC64_SPHPU